MITFKQIFPKWQIFKQYLIDYSVYYNETIYEDKRVLIYWTLLYRFFGNSHLAFTREIFLEMLSVYLAEHFREFFKIRELTDIIMNKDTNDLLISSESITNTAENPNMEPTNDKGLINYIGTQQHQKITNNLVTKVYTIINHIAYHEILTEIEYYKNLFLTVIPRTEIYFEEGDNDEIVYKQIIT